MFNRTIFFVTRFSVFDTDNFELARGSTGGEDYASKLFASARLDDKIQLFEKVAARSVTHQNTGSAELWFVLIVSDALPAKYQDQLVSILDGMERESGIHTDMIYVKSGLESARERGIVHENYSDALDGYLTAFMSDEDDHTFATVRLDDDDAIGASFSRRLTSYLEKGIIGFPISFAQGYEAYYDIASSRFTNVKHWNYPKIALGLSFTNRYTKAGGFQDPRIHVYRLGRHHRIDDNDPVIVDSMTASFVRTISTHNDSGGFQHHEHLIDTKMGEFNYNEFGFLGDFRLPEGQAKRANFHNFKQSSSKFAEVQALLKRPNPGTDTKAVHPPAEAPLNQRLAHLTDLLAAEKSSHAVTQESMKFYRELMQEYRDDLKRANQTGFEYPNRKK